MANRPLRILCCSGSLEGGGSERQLWQLATNLDRSRFTPSLYLHYRSGVYLDRLPSDVPVTAFWDNFRPQQFFLPGQIHRQQIAHLAQHVREHQIDLLYDRAFHTTLVTAPATKRTNLPRVSVIVSPPSSDFSRSRERFRWLKKRALRLAYQSPRSLTIAVSEQVADDAAQFYGLDRQQIRVLHNPVDCNLIVKQSQQSPINSFKPAARRVIIVGRLSSEKGQRLALQALQLANAKSDKPLSLDLVGDGPMRTELEQLAKKFGVDSQVHFHGYVENPYPLMAQAIAVCIPSDYEGLPNVALETLGLGKPLIATDCSGSLRTLIGDNQRGSLVPMYNAQALADCWLKCSTEPEEFRERALAGKEYVEEHHDLQSWLCTMQEIFSTLAIR